MKCFLAYVVFVTVAVSLRSYAGSAGGNATVNIVSDFQFTELSAVNFNTIPNTNGTCSMDKKGRLSGQCNGTEDGQIGEMEIQGEAKQWVNVSVLQLASVDGVTYVPKLASTNSNTDSVKLDKVGKAIIDVIGDLVLQGATGGYKNINYLITIDYQ